MRIFFESFDVDYNSTIDKCDGDFVEVSYDSKSHKFCGKAIPGPFNSMSPITVRMSTDSSGSRSGFNAMWQVVQQREGEIHF